MAERSTKMKRKKKKKNNTVYGELMKGFTVLGIWDYSKTKREGEKKKANIFTDKKGSKSCPIHYLVLKKHISNSITVLIMH